MHPRLTFTAEVYGDHYHIWLQDSESRWYDETGQEFVSVTIHETCLDIHTNTYDMMPMIVALWDFPPEEDPGVWDEIVEVSIAIPTGKLEINELGGGAPLTVTPGTYRMRIYFGNYFHEADDLDCLHGEHYRIDLWPVPPVGPALLRQAPLPPRVASERFTIDTHKAGFVVGDAALPPDPAILPVTFSPTVAFGGEPRPQYDSFRLHTAVTGEIPVLVERWPQAPHENRIPWAAICEATLSLSSGWLVLRGAIPMEPILNAGRPPDRERMAVPPGLYRTRIHRRLIHPAAGPEWEPDEGDELYRIVLWPAEAGPPQVLWPPPRPQ